MKYLVFLLLLGGCALYHEPRLAEVPKDAAKYQKDLQECRAEGSDRWDRAYEANSYAGDSAFGLIGAGVAAASRPKDPTGGDFHKSMQEMTDECFVKRGYKLVEKQ